MEETEVRKDINGNIISKSNKNHHISFKENFSEIIIVESYKEFNKLTQDEYYDFDDDNSSTEYKFDIDQYNPSKVERTGNHDPLAFSKSRCIIL